MVYEFDVKNKKVIFNNNVVRNFELFELEFITDAPKLCRAIRKEVEKVNDPERVISNCDKEYIKASFDKLDAPTNFRVRFCNKYNPENAVDIQITINEC